MKKVNEADAFQELENGYQKAEKLLEDKEKTEEFLQRLEKKLETIPNVGKSLAMVPTMISLIRSYIKKEYAAIPIGTIIAIVSALLYVFMPVDLIPDAILGVGYIDDAAVLSVCLKLVGSDIRAYQKWRDEKKN